MNNKQLQIYTSLLLILSFVFTISTTFAQNIDTNQSEYIHIKFDKSDGYSIDELNSMEFDDDGWLWLTGIKYESLNYKLGARDPIILRFNGHDFYEVPIPANVLEGVSNLVLQKSFNNYFYVKLESQQNSKLYTLDARSLQFKEIKRPNSSIQNLKKFELLKLKDKFLYIQNHDEGNKLYYLDSIDSFLPFGVMRTNENVIGSNAVDLGNRLLISKFTFGLEVFQKNNNKSNGISKSVLKDSILESYFYKNSEVYLNFKKIPTIFKLNRETYDLDESGVFNTYDKSSPFVNQIIYQDKKENVLLERIDGEFSNLNIYGDLNSDPIWNYKFEHITVEGTIIASRDLTKELIIENDNALEVFVFNSDVVKTFLRDLSIRTMVQLEDNSVLIATDFNGWYLLDSNMQTIKPYWPMDKGKRITPSLNRDIHIDNRTIWSNDGTKLLMIDLNTLDTHSFNIGNNISAMAQDDDRVILIDEANNVKLFNKSSFEFKTIIDRDTLVYQNILIKGDSFFAATSGGLKLFNSKGIKLLKPNKKDYDNYIVSILEYPNNQLLLGTRSGELLTFNTITYDFRSIYQDKLEASIASTLIDNKNRIWLNTFAGIVSFNPETNETIRFGINDGFSHYESNRFSALKLKNESFMVGTVKGVNYFNPDSLIDSYNKKRYENELQFISIEHFDENKKSIHTIYNRNKLDSIESITLSAENKNLVLDFGILKPRVNLEYFYRYRFYNSDWIALESKHKIRLSNIESGNYTLEIQAIDKIKNEVLSTLSIGLVAEQYFYKSIWFYSTLLIIILFIILVYTYKWRQANQARYKNKLLNTEIQYKKKDLADFATNISRNQQWNDYLISKMEEIKEAKGRKKGAALVNLEKDIKENSKVIENNFEFQKRIDILNNEFYNSLLKQFPKLSKTEIKICSLIRLNLDNYDIATLQNVDVSSIYKSRYRLRKKLNLASDTDLDAFLKAF